MNKYGTRVKGDIIQQIDHAAGVICDLNNYSEVCLPKSVFDRLSTNQMIELKAYYGPVNFSVTPRLADYPIKRRNRNR